MQWAGRVGYGRPYVVQPLTFLFACLGTENKIRPFQLFIKKLKIGDFPFFPISESVQVKTGLFCSISEMFWEFLSFAMR